MQLWADEYVALIKHLALTPSHIKYTYLLTRDKLDIDQSICCMFYIVLVLLIVIRRSKKSIIDAMEKTDKTKADHFNVNFKLVCWLSCVTNN